MILKIKLFFKTNLNITSSWEVSETIPLRSDYTSFSDSIGLFIIHKHIVLFPAFHVTEEI